MIRRLGDRPRLVAEAAIAVAWLLVLSHPLAVAAGVHHHEGTTYASWLVMSAAMMLPAALPAVQHVAVNSLRRRRHRAVALYVAAYLGVWAIVGAVVVASPWRPGAVVALAAAAAWQLAPWQRRFLRWCHRTVPLPVNGWAATRGSLRFGLRNAAPCVGSCWALMLVAVAVPGTAWMAALTAAVGVAKTDRRPVATSRRIGYTLVVATLVALPASGAYAPLGALAVLVAVVPASALRQAMVAARAIAAPASTSP